MYSTNMCEQGNENKLREKERNKREEKQREFLDDLNFREQAKNEKEGFQTSYFPKHQKDLFKKVKVS